MTQLESARAGTVTPEMAFVATREDLPEETIRSEVARGRMVIPANAVHLTKRHRGLHEDQRQHRQLRGHQRRGDGA